MNNFVRAVCASLSIAATASLACARINAQVPTLQKVFTIGCESCGGALEFTAITEVAVNTRGELLVADRSAPFLRQFDVAGKSVWQGGVKGKGPGEYTGITRMAWLSNGTYNIVDGGGNRVTVLSKDRTVKSTMVLPAYPTTASVNDAGSVVIGQELMMERGFNLLKLKGGSFEKIAPPSVAGNPIPTYNAASVAVSPTGTIALWPHNEKYEIFRMDSAGTSLPAIVRGVERVRYTVVEDSIRREKAGREMAQLRAMAGIKSGPPAPSGPPPLKPYTWGDALRYDPKGRLWARTNLGDEKHTVLDVFSPTGAFLGSVNIAGVIREFAFGGTWLATSAENDDGVLLVTMWNVR